jgi:hypothetical protein
MAEDEVSATKESVSKLTYYFNERAKHRKHKQEDTTRIKVIMTYPRE